jgi:diphosphomevalonate decarboxylase
MDPQTVTALAHPNIALIKYWGDRDSNLHIPLNGSISMNLGGLFTRAQVSLNPNPQRDELRLNGVTANPDDYRRVSAFLDHIRELSGRKVYFTINSHNNFPTSAGIASSASAFAALALAATKVCDLDLTEPELTRLARMGSGSACRSIPAGYVEWIAGYNHATSFARSIASPEHWDLTDCIALISQEPKSTSSTQGHALASSSPLQAARLQTAEQRLQTCRQAILDRDFNALAQVVELDSNLMHSVMITSTPPLLYWQPPTLAVMHAIQNWRLDGFQVCYTIDAGPNVHVLCPTQQATEIATRLRNIPGVIQVLTARPGGATRIIENE